MLILFELTITESVYSQNFLSKTLLQKGVVAPEFNLKTSAGDSIELSDYKGKIVILDFWYVGCRPCVKAYQDIKALEEELSKDKFVVIGMNPITRKNKINRYIRKGKYADKVVLCSKEIITAYQVSAYPTIYIINKNGNIAFSTAGYSVNFKDQIKKAILKESILKESINKETENKEVRKSR